MIGVSVAGPDAAGGFDFFAGAWWVHRDKDGTVRTRLMVPTVPGTVLSDATVGADGPAPEAVDMECQDTIADLYGDGMAEVLIGTSDGRVYIFHTGLKYTPESARPMFGGIYITRVVGLRRNIEMIAGRAGSGQSRVPEKGRRPPPQPSPGVPGEGKTKEIMATCDCPAGRMDLPLFALTPSPPHLAIGGFHFSGEAQAVHQWRFLGPVAKC